MAKNNKEPKVKVPNAWSNKKNKDGGGSSGSGGGTGKLSDSVWTLCITILAILLILFVFLGGINQRKAIEWVKDFSENIGKTVSGWFNPDNIEVNEDGVYYRPDGIPTETDENGNPIETEEGSTDNTDQGTEQSGEESSNQSVEESVSEQE